MWRTHVLLLRSCFISYSDHSTLPASTFGFQFQPPAVCGHLHKRLVVVANLLDVHAELGIDIGLDGAVTMGIVTSTAHQSGGILQGALVLQASGGHSAMAMSSLQHAWELGELELQVHGEKEFII